MAPSCEGWFQEPAGWHVWMLLGASLTVAEQTQRLHLTTWVEFHVRQFDVKVTSLIDQYR